MYRFYTFMHYSIIFILFQRLLKAQNIYIESFFTQLTLLILPIDISDINLYIMIFK